MITTLIKRINQIKTQLRSSNAVVISGIEPDTKTSILLTSKEAFEKAVKGLGFPIDRIDRQDGTNYPIEYSITIEGCKFYCIERE